MATTNLGRVRFRPRGGYNPAADPLYSLLDLVSDGGGSFVYINDTPSNEPTSSTSHWQQIASMGGQDLVDAAVAARDAAQGHKDAAAAYAAQLAAGLLRPKGTYANLTALNAGTPTVADTNEIYITLDDGKWCYWNGSAWVAGGAFQAVSIAADFADTQKAIGYEKINFTSGFNVATGVSAGDAVNLTPGAVGTYSYAIVDCSPGDVFTINGAGGSSPRLWAFVDSDNLLISNSIAGAPGSQLVLVAPAGASKIIINSLTSSLGRCYVGVSPSFNFAKWNDAIHKSSKLSLFRAENFIAKEIHYDGSLTNSLLHITDNVIYYNIGDSMKVFIQHGYKAKCVYFKPDGNPTRTESDWAEGPGTLTPASDYSFKVMASYVDGSAIDPGDYADFESNVFLGSEAQASAAAVKANVDEIGESTNNLFNQSVACQIDVGGYSTGDVVSLTRGVSTLYRSAIVTASPGDVFYVSGAGGGNPRQWAFLDADNKLLTMSAAYAVSDNAKIVAPYATAKLICNFNISTQPNGNYIYKDEGIANGLLKSKIKEIEFSVSSSTADALDVLGYFAPDSVMHSLVNGLKFTDEIEDYITDFKKTGDLMVHVSTFCIISGIVYCTYYANTRSSGEVPTEQTARFCYFPLNDPSSKTFVDLCDIGDSVDGKTVNQIYDTILLRKDDDVLYLMWTAVLDNQYYRLYKTYTIATDTYGETLVNNFTVGSTTVQFRTEGMNSAFSSNSVTHKYISGDIGIMQRLTSRVEGGTTYYYTGCYAGEFNCIIKSADLINWVYVSQPDFNNSSQWENTVYVIGDKAFYFCRQLVTSRYGFLTYYDLSTGLWARPVWVPDTQSRSDFFVSGGDLYLVHAPRDRYHIALMKIDQTYLNKSEDVQCACLSGSCFYPFVQEYSGELYMSYTYQRTGLYLCKFTVYPITVDAILGTLKTLFLGA